MADKEEKLTPEEIQRITDDALKNEDYYEQALLEAGLEVTKDVK